ncbi:MAG: hypothetical protein H0V12_11525 [Chloroflexi bacterium]|nr:hypothetical protein [Chloroflexota bacterium]
MSGSPSAAENPPHDTRWRRAIAAVVADWTVAPARHAGFDFLLEPERRPIDLDNLVRLAVDGLRDGGVVRGARDLDVLVATKRVGYP